MDEIWRVIDTGLRPAAQNIALNRALLEARQAEEIPSTLRFLRFAPSALLGYHQSAEQELNLDYCKAHNIAIQRRITGGGAIYTDETQLDWELYLHQRDVGTWDMQAIAKRICHAAASAISALGVDARFRPRSDIEVDGRKILASGSVCDGDALLYQGTLLIDLDPGEILRVLRLPVRDVSDAATASARGRLASLKDLLGCRADPVRLKRLLTEAFESEFDVEFREADLTLTEHARYRTALAEIDTMDWVHLVNGPVSDTPFYDAVHRLPEGTLNASVIYDSPTASHKAGLVQQQYCCKPAPYHRGSRGGAAGYLGRASRSQCPNVLCRTARRYAFVNCQDDFIAVTRLATQQPIVAPSRA